MKKLQAYSKGLVSQFGRQLRAGEILAKILTPNEDSGHHGVVVPIGAYPFLPNLVIANPRLNTAQAFNAFDLVRGEEVKLAYKYYQRYPERRLTRLNSLTNKKSANYRLVVLLKTRQQDQTHEYFIDTVISTDNKFQHLYRLLFGNSVEPEYGQFVIRSLDSPAFSPDDNLNDLLDRFDAISDMGWIESLRDGDTGIGYTFESLMGIKENNERTADFKGIEIKCKGVKDGANPKGGKINLFQAGPEWTDGRSAMDRLRIIGQLGKNELYRCHSQITTRVNGRGLCLEILGQDGRINLRKGVASLGYWSFDLLRRRLSEKHSRAVFIKAQVNKGKKARFKYEQLIYCERPSFDNFLGLVEARNVVLEFLMSEKLGGSVRNRGYPWRLVREQFLEQLFSFQIRLRG